MANPDKLCFSFEYKPSSGINFIETAWYYLSPFSAHEVELDGVTYKTAEHAYQALRMLPEARAEVMATKSPMDSWRKAQELKQEGKVDPTCDKLELIKRIFRAKLEQHSDIKAVLIESGDQTLLKIYDTDHFWGTGPDGSGENHMGKIWMKLRNEI